ncbi:MAG: prolipoprotein diacylglyceryl transferase [Elusimicrobia bacterium]|nr:prolipoprotein diacylglyceryl transferase [Elusimicrobiota bacterium]
MLPVLLKLGPLTFYSYGALIALGAFLGFGFLHGRRGAMGFKKDEHFWLFINVVLIGGFVGGRLLHMAEYVPWSDPEWWAKATGVTTGYSILGAFAAVVLGVYVLCRRLGLEFLRVWDYFSVVLPLWHFFGRLGCLAAGCCHGRPSGVPWAVTFSDPRALVLPELMGRPLHPTQLYEALPELGMAAVFYRFLLRPLEQGRLRPGFLSAAYVAAYAVLRFLNEFYRADVVELPGLGLTAAQAMCVALFAAALGLALWLRRAPPCSRSS